MNNLETVENNFRNLIISQCKFCKFDEYLKQNPDFEFPKINSNLLGWENGEHITIPGLFGGFSYFLEINSGELVLYAEQSSRMDYDSNDYTYFEITQNENRILKSEERETAQKKFRQLDRKGFEEHRRRMKERRRHEPSERE